MSPAAAKGSTSSAHDAAASSSPSSPTPVRPPPWISADYPDVTPASRNTASGNPRVKTSPNVPSYSSDFAAEAGRYLQYATQPQLSERDSIFATHYTGDDSVASASKRSLGLEGAELRRDQKEGTSIDQPGMALSLPQRSFVMPASKLSMDVSPSGISLTKGDFPKSPVKRPSSRSNLPLQYQRRSLYDLADLGGMAIPKDQEEEKEARTPDKTATPVQSAPTTPNTSTPKQLQFVADADGSAERQQYRSWRTGKAKLEGLTIAQSQRRQSRAEVGVDKVIDAQLPQPEPPVNVRSRKASHYLGLFKENDATSRRGHDKPNPSRIVEDDEMRRNRDVSRGSDAISKRSVKNDIEATEDGNQVTVSKDRMSQQLPLGLLEEIRNHHHIAPGQTRKIPYAKVAPSRDVDRVRSLDRVLKEADDEESDREHISSATYFPHQGVVLGDSPTDEPEAQKRPRTEAGPPRNSEQKKGGEDVQIALRRDDTSDCLHGDLSLTREPSAHDLETQGKHAQAQERLASDSEYESGYSTAEYDSQVSDEEELTPTATPTSKSTLAQQKRIHQRRQSQPQPPAPVGAVELKPYRHQVGGHTTVYRFSRRAVCKQLNSKENMFYETVERHHPELLGFMPRSVIPCTEHRSKSTMPSESTAQH